MGALFYTACQPQNPYAPAAGLTPKLSPAGIEANRSWAQCNQCHPMDSLSSTHKYHLIDQSIGPNGPISCLDCHFNSVQYQAQTDADGTRYLPLFQEGTAFKDSNGVVHSYQNTMDVNELIDFVETYKQYRTFPTALGNHFPVQKTRAPQNGGTHNNGQLDLVFAPNIVDHDSLLAHGRTQPWNGTDFTCEAMKCHSGYSSKPNSSFLYQWKKPFTKDED